MQPFSGLVRNVEELWLWFDSVKDALRDELEVVEYLRILGQLSCLRNLVVNIYAARVASESEGIAAAEDK